MYSKTQFRQLLEGLPRGVFEKQVAKLDADKYNKGFRSWDQLIAMLFGHLSDSKSLRELEAGFNAQAAHHYHLGTRPIKRSTLADANAKRSCELFASISNAMVHSMHRKVKRELKQLLYLLDSSPISLQGHGFDHWAHQYKSNVGQGLKLHMAIEAHEATPAFVMITGAQVSDIKIGRTIPVEKGATYVFDKGYYDYNWWHQIEERKSKWVTRLKKNANVSVQHYHAIPAQDSQILEDAAIQFNNRYVKSRTENNAYYKQNIRRVIVNRPDKSTPLILVTNDFERSAEEIAALYKKRWDIELFFKWIKQNLKIKRFIGRSENAVKTQIYTAIISYLLLQLHQQKHNIKTSLKLCLSALRVGLFQRVETEQIIAKRQRRRRMEMQKSQLQLAI
jgi:IS4 transposase